ncbi:MAG: TcpQ domain-containing protein [Alphaproteobacteria bacterium]|nr:TcpQ domain-containing protein [Alphaproteobacteria bacterium]
MAISMACAMALAMTCLPSTAHAEFVYVPPDPPIVDAARGSGSDIGSTAAGETGAAASPLRVPASATGDGRAHPAGDTDRPVLQDTGLWHVRADETLRGVLGRWGAQGGIDVIFLTDRRYRLHEARVFEGSFAEATEALFGALSHLPHPPVGELRSGDRTFAVLHRARLQGHGR